MHAGSVGHSRSSIDGLWGSTDSVCHGRRFSDGPWGSITDVYTARSTPPTDMSGTTAPKALTMGPNETPIPDKLLQKIWRGEFIHMTELLPNRLTQTNEASGEPAGKAGEKKPSRAKITMLAQRVECFNAYN